MSVFSKVSNNEIQEKLEVQNETDLLCQSVTFGAERTSHSSCYERYDVFHRYCNLYIN